MNRRSFFPCAFAIGLAGLEFSTKHSGPSIAIFEKILQTMEPHNLAEALEFMGADGIESTIRAGGRIAPSQAARAVPELVTALEKKNRKVLIAATDITDDRHSNRELLRILKDNGILQYRMGYYRFKNSIDLRKQLAEFKSIALRLAELNEQLGLQAIYQNHAGGQHVGSAIWDIDEVLGDISPSHIALALDLRHLVVEAGMSWKTKIQLAKERVGCLYVKDSRWQPQPGQIRNVPLGEGFVDQKVFAFARKHIPTANLCLHLEYYGQKPLTGEKQKAAIQSFKNDITTLKGWLNHEKK